MNKILRSIPLALALVFTPLGHLVQAQLRPTNTADTAKLKTEIVRRRGGDNSSVTIVLRNGSEVKGRITETSDNMFTLKEIKTGHRRDVAYAEVAKIRGRGLSRGAKFGILTAIITGVVVIGAIISLKKSDPFAHGVLR
jgi:small nuclear ribonucleoprotein (snRNP)-like protein